MMVCGDNSMCGCVYGYCKICTDNIKIFTVANNFIGIWCI